MSNYPTVPGLDRAKYEALLNAEILHPLPQDAVLVIGADWCFDTQNSLKDSDYPTHTSDGRPIVYLNDADPEAHTLLGTLAGKELLGGGVDSPTPPSRPTREYNYPTVLSTHDGAITGILYADTVPAGMLTDPAMMRLTWEAGASERARRAEFPKYDKTKGNEVFDRQGNATLQPDHVYAIVSRNCSHCHELLARSDYPTHTEDGRPITYLADTPDFYGQPLAELGVTQYPTFITTDRQGRPGIAATGPDAVIDAFFPALAAKERANAAMHGPAPSLLPEEETMTLPPSPVAAISHDEFKALGSALGTQFADLHAHDAPGSTPAEAAAKSGIVRNG